MQLRPSVKFVTILAMVLAATPLLAAAREAPAQRSVALTLTGSLGHLPDSNALLIVEGEKAVGHPAEPHGGPPKLLDYPLVITTVRSSSFRVSVPESGLLRSLADQNDGYVEFIIIADSGRSTTSLAEPVAVGKAAGRGGDLAAADELATHRFAFPRFPRFQPMRTSTAVIEGMLIGRLSGSRRADGYCCPPPPCAWVAYRKPAASNTSIGQVDVAKVNNGPTDNYKFTVTDDAYVTFGYSVGDPSGKYKLSGSVHLSDTLSASGHKKFGTGTGNGYLHYVDTKMNYQRYEDDGIIDPQCPNFQK